MNPMIKRKTTTCLALAAAALLGAAAPAQVLTNESVAISSGAGGGGGGAQTSCMIFSDGTSWSGGAVGVQGASSVNDTGGSTAAANDAFKYSVGSVADSLNATYGAGNWTIANPELTFQYTLYANNPRFNAGAGTFSIYWMANDSWVQGTANPVYATTGAALATWAGNASLLANETYTWSTPGYTGTLADLHTSNWTTDSSGIRQATVSYGLALDPSFVTDITSATAAADPNVSLYLMSTSASLGLTIFTGGGQILPTLSFEVVPVPEPSVLAMSLSGLALIATVRRWRK
jgi:hypothetical protein